MSFPAVSAGRTAVDFSRASEATLQRMASTDSQYTLMARAELKARRSRKVSVWMQANPSASTRDYQEE